MNSKLLCRSLTQVQNPIINRSYYTSRTKKPSLYTKMSPLGHPTTSLATELDAWVKDGHKVCVAELHRIIHDFRKHKRFSQALQVSEWMEKKGICIFSPVEHAVQLDLIGKVRGFDAAEDYFNNLRDKDKNSKTYGALLNCYVRQRQTDKSILHLQKMKEMGFASSALAYNNIMCLYTNVSEHHKVPSVLGEMKENNVNPDNFSYRICINSYGERSDLEGMERVLKEMEERPGIIVDWNTYSVVANFYIKAGIGDKAVDALRKAEGRLEKGDGIGYNHLITLHASLGNKSEVLRIWDLEKVACSRYINRDYATMLESLVKLGEIEETAKVLQQWESSGNSYDFRLPNVVIMGYCTLGLYEKAEALLGNLMEKGKDTTPNSWGIVAAGYLRKKEMEKALKCMKAAISLYAENKSWKPNPRVVSGILNWLGNEGNLKAVNDFVSALKTVVPVDRRMYHALLKANIRDGKEVKTLLDCMEADKIDKDEETKRILETMQK